jgi:hypothetical protein
MTITPGVNSAALAKLNFIFSIYLSTLACAFFTLVSFDLVLAFATLKLLGVALVFHSFVYCISRETGSLSVGILTSFMLLALPALNAYLGPIATLIWWIMSLWIIVRNLYRLRSWLLFLTHYKLLIPSVMLIAAIILSRPYTTFNMVMRLQSGDVHQDSLFHGALSAMIKTYGVSSLGLSGLVTFKYHWFSHALIAGVSQISNVDILTVIGVIPVLFFAPILIGLLTSFAFVVTNYAQPKYFVVSSTICVILAGSTILLKDWGVFMSNWYQSESYLVGLVLFMAFMLDTDGRMQGVRSVFIVFGLTLLCTLSKGPIGLAVVAIQVGRSLMVTNRKSLTTLLVSVVGFLFGSSFVIGGSSLSIDPLSFPQLWFRGGSYISSGTIVVGLFVLSVGIALHFCLPMVTLILSINPKNRLTDRQFVMDLIVLLLFGAGAILLLGLGAANEVYFSMLSWTVSISIMAILLVERLRSSAIFFQRNQITMLVLVMLSFLIVERKSARDLIVKMYGKYGENRLVSELTLRQRSDIGKFQVFDDLSEASANPFRRCTARPFLYPAVSERAWIGVIESNQSPCDYYGYGYEDYRNSIRVNPSNTLGGKKP